MKPVSVIFEQKVIVEFQDLASWLGGNGNKGC